jgi:hypothetical protein
MLQSRINQEFLSATTAFAGIDSSLQALSLRLK